MRLALVMLALLVTALPAASIEQRHAPIPGSVWLDRDELLRLIESLGNISDPRLAGILDSLQDSAEKGDAEAYSHAAELLRNYLENPQASQSALQLSPQDLEKLALLASSSLDPGSGGASADIDVYSELLEQLSSSGILENPELESLDLGGIVESLEQDVGLPEDALAKYNTPLDNPEPPRLTGLSVGLPRGPSTAVNLEDLARLLLVGGLAAAVLAGVYAYRSRVFEAVSGLREAGKISMARLAGLDPRSRVIECFKAFVAMLSRRGYPKESWETAREYANRLGGTPWAAVASRIARLYEKARYSQHPVEPGEADECFECLEEVRRA